jgi:putative DNA primase/helicase
LIEHLVPRPLKTINISPPGLFRTIEKFRPTLLIDEGDTFLRNNDGVRGVLNAGHTRGDYAIRLTGDNHDPTPFQTFGSKAIALIGYLPETLADRSIPIEMRRKMQGETVERLDVRKLENIFRDLKARARRWAEDHSDALDQVETQVPDQLNDRAADNWRHMLEIANQLGGEWPTRVRAAAVALSGPGQDDNQSVDAQLLSDIQDIFNSRDGTTDITSEALIEKLASLEDRPWAEWHRGKPISKAALAKHLKPFGIRPQKWREGAITCRGYRRADFEDAWSRYIPDQSPEDPPQAPLLPHIPSE